MKAFDKHIQMIKNLDLPWDIQAFEEARESFEGFQSIQPSVNFADLYKDNLEWLQTMSPEQRLRRQQWMEKNIRAHARKQRTTKSAKPIRKKVGKVLAFTSNAKTPTVV